MQETQRRDPLCFAPVFVLCTARSYSSVITCMIGQHPQLFAFPELKLFAYRTLGELDASLPRSAREPRIRHRSPGLVRAVAEFEFGGQDEEALRRALAWLRVRAGWTGIQVLDFLMERLGPLTAIEKSPETVVEDGALERMTAAYPRARFIHLVRHPVATVLSMSAHLAARLPDYDAAAYGEQCVEAWLASHERISSFTQRQAAKRVITVRAEELLQDPRTHLGRIARSLGLRADVASITSMLHPERSPFACFASERSGVSGGFDPAFLADPRPRAVQPPASLALPAEWKVAPDTWSRLLAVTRQLGYQEPSSEFARA